MKRSRGRPKQEPPVPDRTPLIGDASRQFSLASNRDSDASYGTNRQSYTSSVGHTIPINDKAYKDSAIRTINDYLASHSVPFSLKPPLPSAKDITNTIRFILSRLDWPMDNIKLEEDLPVLMRDLKCPFKLNKSALKAPGTPHTWPALLSVIHWLAQIAIYNDHISGSTLSATTSAHSFFQDNELLRYALDSYSFFIIGDDDAVEALDNEFAERLEEKKDAVAEEVSEMEKEALKLEEKLQIMRSAPSAKEVLDRKKTVLEEDIHKFHAIIDEYKRNITSLEKDLEKMEKELDVKVSENQSICEENKELNKAIEAQKFNLRDVDRMRREIQSLEREISEAEAARNEWEEKSWELDALLGQKLKELENLSVECNQAIRRLKNCDSMQFKLNRNGSTPADVLGNDYKSTLKPALLAFEDDLKKNSMAKLEESISLQQQSQDIINKLTEKRNRLAEIQSQINKSESELSSMKKEIQDYTSTCRLEAKRLVEEFEKEKQNLEMMEIKAEDALRNSREQLQNVTKQSDDDIQMCARELLMLVDSVSKYKEHMESAVLDVKRDFSETAEAVSIAYKSSLVTEFGSISKWSCITDILTMVPISSDYYGVFMMDSLKVSHRPH